MFLVRKNLNSSHKNISDFKICSIFQLYFEYSVESQNENSKLWGLCLPQGTRWPLDIVSILYNYLDLFSFQIHICCETDGEINVLALIQGDHISLVLTGVNNQKSPVRNLGY